jgi:hypothetical protein
MQWMHVGDRSSPVTTITRKALRILAPIPHV